MRVERKEKEGAVERLEDVSTELEELREEMPSLREELAAALADKSKVERFTFPLMAIVSHHTMSLCFLRLKTISK